MANNRHRTPLSFIQRIIGRGNNNLRGKGIIDVRTFSREVAIHTMVKVVFGRRYGSNEIIINSLREMVAQYITTTAG